MKLHIVLHNAYRTEKDAADIIAAAQLTNYNLKRAKLFRFSVITANGDLSAKNKLGQMPQVDYVQIDQEIRIV